MLIDFTVKRGRVYMDVKDLLAYLADHPGDVIGKQELAEALAKWHNKVVNR